MKSIDAIMWRSENEKYLAGAISWIHHCFNALIELPSSQNGTDVNGNVGWLHGVSKPEKAVVSRLGRKTKKTNVAMFEKMGQRMDPPPAIEILAQRFNLTIFERNILLLCVAMELDPDISTLCMQAHRGNKRPYPTFSLAFSLFDDPVWNALLPMRPLRYWKLIEINSQEATPLTLCALSINERILNYCMGVNQMDDFLAPLFIPFDDLCDDHDTLATSHSKCADIIGERILHHLEKHSLPVIQLTGANSAGKQRIVRRIITMLELDGYRMPSVMLANSADAIEEIARLCLRESNLSPFALYVEVSEDGEDSDRTAANRIALKRFLSRCNSLIFLDTRDSCPGLENKSIVFEIKKPLPVEQYDTWLEALGPMHADISAELVGQFNLDISEIKKITREASEQQPDNDADEQRARHLWNLCRIHTRPRLERLAERIETKARWNNFVLPEEPLKLLRDISAQVKQRTTVYDQWGFRRTMNRGFGITALFAGDSGTGKTMAAEIIANELELDLYRIDLSSVVSKYIGETEKNLRRVFDAAEEGGAILFFDEADALFGKRSEVKDSHDRFANIEINYLLQRMESYNGLAILATNLKTALDSAFVRRIRFIVNFPFPGTAERRQIWKEVFPSGKNDPAVPSTPLDTLNFEHLARFNVAGGSIHNIALNAAFIAADKHTAVSMTNIFDAVRMEMRKLDRPINEYDFRLPNETKAKA